MPTRLWNEETERATKEISAPLASVLRGEGPGVRGTQVEVAAELKVAIDQLPLRISGCHANAEIIVVNFATWPVS